MTANRRRRVAGAMLAATGVLLAAIVHGAEPDTAVRAAWSELDAAWNARDADRFSAVFTAEASFDFVDRGEGFDSRDEIHASFAARFPKFAPELRHATTVRDVRTLGDELAAVDGTVEVLRHGPDEEAVDVLKRFAIFAVMERRQRRWYIAMLRAYELPPEAAASQPRAAPRARRGTRSVLSPLISLPKGVCVPQPFRDDTCIGSDGRPPVPDPSRTFRHAAGLAVETGLRPSDDDDAAAKEAVQKSSHSR